MELNPNHPVTQMAHDNWHKLCAALMVKFGLTAVEITMADMEELGHNEKGIALDLRGGKCVLRLLTMEEGERLARGEGGLPV